MLQPIKGAIVGLQGQMRMHAFEASKLRTEKSNRLAQLSLL
jgi:hypothetical protein